MTICQRITIYHLSSIILLLGHSAVPIKSIVAEVKPEYSKLIAVPFDEVQVEDDFWSPRIETVQKVTIPDLLNLAESQGKIDNFAIVAGLKEGKLRLHNAPDSDVYKLIEAACYTLAWRRNGQLEQRIDRIIALIAAAQMEDGYVNTQYTLPFTHPASPAPEDGRVRRYGYGPEWLWRSTLKIWPKGYAQLYCAGHLLEAAAAHYRVAGHRNFLDVALKLADHLYRRFPPGKPLTYADHPQVGIGLMKLYEVTGEPRYLQLADHLVNNAIFARPVDFGEGQNQQPLRKQRKAYGHSVRINYIYSAATDLCRYLGDEPLRETLDSLWHSIVDKRIYVHGGVGGPAHAEQVAEDYLLDNSNCYCESCANIAHGQWNHRLNLMYADAKFADLLELEAYNSALSGISLDGLKYFYTNKLNMKKNGRHNQHSGVRKRYLFCCPAKLPGFVAGINRWIYAQDDKSIYVNLFIGSKTQVKLENNTVMVHQQTDYPWKGQTKITLEPKQTGSFDICLRIPGWLRSDGHIPGNLYSFAKTTPLKYQVIVNDRKIDWPALDKGYARIRRAWKKGDCIELHLTMPIRRIYAHSNVEANRSRVALMRGPLIYCLEGVDHDFSVLNMALPKDAEITPLTCINLLNGITILKGKGLADGERKVDFTAVPYFSWQNRGIDELATWLIEDPKLHFLPQRH